MEPADYDVALELAQFRGESSASHQSDSCSASHLAQNDAHNVQELSAIDSGWKAWRFVICAFTVEAMVWGFGDSFGIFQGKPLSGVYRTIIRSRYVHKDYYTSHPPFSSASAVVIAAVGTSASAIQFGERYPDYMRLCAWFGLGLCVLSLLASSFVSQVGLLVFLQGVCLGIGGGLLYYPILELLPQWFNRRRGLATSIVFSGAGMGGCVFPYLLQAMLDRIGFRWTLRVWALTLLVTVGFAMLGLQPRLPTPKFQHGQSRPRFIHPQMQFIKSAQFWALTLSWYSVSLYIAPYARIISPLSASIALSLFNSSGVVCQLVIGHLVDWLPYTWIMFICSLGSAIAVFTLWGFAHSVPLLFAFAIVFGGLMGGFLSVSPAAAADCAGNKPEQVSMIWACSYLTRSVAAVLGPVIAGILYDMGRASAGSAVSTGWGLYGCGKLEIFVGVCAAATSATTVLTAAARRRSDTTPRAGGAPIRSRKRPFATRGVHTMQNFARDQLA
ncbi:MFS general substrate transporter [Wolfiporia cocos MD-104 SS10]|uniref:MFS general substrate transporter n=1 Tax=Wolfiporia cocos (strain MD-104) TaxID=742152 RepID=A0A2H3K7Y8_WOLCO|nr:MFS general substrate transporter [Wolfiporia cocos MD-104 SS10]